jgi:hypothetical protein
MYLLFPLLQISYNRGPPFFLLRPYQVLSVALEDAALMTDYHPLVLRGLPPSSLGWPGLRGCLDRHHVALPQYQQVERQSSAPRLVRPAAKPPAKPSPRKPPEQVLLKQPHARHTKGHVHGIPEIFRFPSTPRRAQVASPLGAGRPRQRAKLPHALPLRWRRHMPLHSMGKDKLDSVGPLPIGPVEALPIASPQCPGSPRRVEGGRRNLPKTRLKRGLRYAVAQGTNGTTIITSTSIKMCGIK